jgi:hypothetical protein
VIATECGWELYTKDDQITVTIDGQTQYVINVRAKGVDISRERLMLVEKQAAIALLAKPACFAVAIETNGWERCRKLNLVRVVVGLYMVNGSRCFQRFTAYCDVANSYVALLEGEDRLFAEEVTSIADRIKGTEIAESRAAIAGLIRHAQEHYRGASAQEQEFAALEDCRSKHLFELDLLYERRSKQHIRTFGVDLGDCKSRPPSANEEYQRRKLDIRSRFLPRVATQVISAGVVVTPAKGRRAELQTPFFPDLGDGRWIMPWSKDKCSS